MLINLSNHPSINWASEQLNAAKVYGEIVDLPFPEVNPMGDELYIVDLAKNYAQQIKQLLLNAPDMMHAVHVMGELTFCFTLISHLKNAGITCVASTSQRMVTQHGNEKVTQFKFVQFRKYNSLCH